MTGNHEGERDFDLEGGYVLPRLWNEHTNLRDVSPTLPCLEIKHLAKAGMTDVVEDVLWIAGGDGKLYG